VEIRLDERRIAQEDNKALPSGARIADCAISETSGRAPPAIQPAPE
jgi:hypothetical protein